MTVGTLDQHQDSEGTGFGFGQAAGVKYRGQVWTCGISGSLGTVGFSRDLPSVDIKVYIDTASANVPDHAVGSELYSFTIPNASCANGYGTYDLPVPLAGLVAGTKYCFYLAPFSGGVYTDDYHDCHGVAAGTVELTADPTFRNENLTFHYATYMIPIVNPSFRTVNPNGGSKLRPRPFAGGLAR